MRHTVLLFFFFFSSRRRHTRFDCDWSSDVCSSDLLAQRHGSVSRLVRVADRERASRRGAVRRGDGLPCAVDRKSTRLNSSHSQISYAVFCLKKKKNKQIE